MKKSMIMVLVAAISLVCAGLAYADKAMIRTATGKVMAVDTQKMAIVITDMSGGQDVTVGATVRPDTTILVKGKKASLDEIKEGDTVSLTWERSDDLYARQIKKK
ncbi:MAG TPA: hypothetical protein VMT62_04940 [Syntrophorhabdaceae bacterium]|nr:hypothetical protein [Syntrophorhabdaceae bacterium]